MKRILQLRWPRMILPAPLASAVQPVLSLKQLMEGRRA
jgi:inorganic triphosphatase YgiF